MTTPGGWPNDFPSDLFWASQQPMSPEDAGSAALRILMAAGHVPENCHGLRVLDLGCGRGEVAIAMADLGAEVTGIDSDAMRIEEAIRAAARVRSKASFLVADATHVIPDAPYDLIYCHYTGWGYGGVESVRATMDQVRRALCQDGVFIHEGYDAEEVLRRFEPDLHYARHVDGRTWNVSVRGALVDASNGGVARIEQEWRYLSPGGTFHDARSTVFEPLTRSHLAAIAGSVGLKDPEDVPHAGEDRSITRSARTMLRFERSPCRRVSELARRMRAAWSSMRTAPAVTDVHGGLSGREILDASTRIEIALRTGGTRPGQPVAVLLPRSWAWPAAMVGVLSSHGAFCPIDPDQPDDRIHGILSSLKPSAVVCFAQDVERHALEGDVRIDVLAPGPLFEDLVVLSRRGARTLPEGTSHVFHTSGSTGVPKGVLLHERGLLDTIDAQRRLLPVAPGVTLWALGPGFDASLSDVLCAVLSARTLRILRAKASRIHELRSALRLVDCADLPPSMLRMLSHETSSIEGLVFGGERAEQSVASGLGGVPYGFQAYGPTEASVCITVAFPSGRWRNGIIGRPLVEDTVAIMIDGVLHAMSDALDPDDPNAVAFDPPLPDGAIGEIVATGSCVAIGYLDAPERDAERFPRIDGARVHLTGDMVRIEGSHVVWTGRTDRQVKINGRMVCPEEIEAFVSRTAPGARARVVVRDGRILLFVSDASIPDDLANRVAESLGATFRPARVLRVERMPLGTSGKPDDSKLMEMAN